MADAGVCGPGRHIGSLMSTSGAGGFALLSACLVRINDASVGLRPETRIHPRTGGSP